MSWFAKPSPNWIVRWATWFGMGRVRQAPGTVGTLGALPVILVLYALGYWPYLIGAVLISYFAIEVAERYEKKYQAHDPKEVVIDEVAGFVVAMAWLPFTWQSFLYAFLLFRFLDIVKPYPIRWIDEKSRGGLGVVADDLLAGIITNIILQVMYVNTDWLGAQWNL